MSTVALRIGIVLESLLPSAWIASIIDQMQASGCARVEVVLLTSARSVQRLPAIFTYYEQWDRGRNKAVPDALAPVSLAAGLAEVPCLSLRDGTDRLDADQLATLQELRLDVILQFSAATIPTLAGQARFGVLTFAFDHRENAGSAAALFLRVFDRNPVAPCSIEISSPLGQRVAYAGYAAVDPASLYRTRNPVYWKIAAAAVRVLGELSTRGELYVDSLPFSPAPCDERNGGTPNALSMTRFAGREVSRWLRARAASLRSSADPKWCIGIRRRTPDRGFDDPGGYHMMPSASDRFYADPFLFELNGTTFLFFEDFRYAEGRALISVCTLDAEGRPGAPIEVLRQLYHLSYPYVFEDEGEIYMIPETRGNRAVKLFRANNFPSGWIEEVDLLSDIAAVDSTIQRIDGRLWMFTGVSNGAYSNSDELWLFSSDTLRGPWKPHPKNPVVSDVQRARPAGILFYEGGRLIRPSQDCGKAYGYALVFSEILTLTETEYEERLVYRITPERIPHAISNHTYNRTDDFEVVDRTLPARIANGDGA